MGKNISRRDVLKAGLFGAGALVLGIGGIYQFNKPTLANRLLERFPETIQGARDIHKYEIENANKTLVHVKQAHIAKEITPEQRDYIARVQKDIYQILKYLNETQGINEVYSEGLIKKKGINLNLDLSFYDAKTGEITDAPALLELEGKIKQILVEDTKIYLEALMPNATMKNIFSDRENAALDIISKSQKPLNVLVYGGLHWFGDNIHEWNQRNPNKKYSLIEITPKNYGNKK